MAYVGGIRDRLILENVHVLVEDALEDLGWFDVGRNHETVTVISEQMEDDVELVPNVVAISDEDMDMDDLEIGSNYREYRWQVAIDVYAEDASIGKHLTGDVRSILEGKFPSIGRVGSNIAITDYSLATPAEIFHVEIENVVQGRQRFYQKPYQRFWWTILFDVVDSYGDEDDD